MIGEKFNRWTVIADDKKTPCGHTFLCRCDCGTEKIVNGNNLKRGLSRSCGCLLREMLAKVKRGNAYSVTHGHTRGGKTPEYATWHSMRQRCENPRSPHYRYYGARGIRVCNRWQRFEHFLEDMGRKPSPSLSIDRIDNDGNYELSNTRWATKSEQVRNRRPAS